MNKNLKKLVTLTLSATMAFSAFTLQSNAATEFTNYGDNDSIYQRRPKKFENLGLWEYLVPTEKRFGKVNDDNFFVGDINEDGCIDPQDATYIYTFMNRYEEYKRQPKHSINDKISIYMSNTLRIFPVGNQFFDGVPVDMDTNKDGVLNKKDADLILEYYNWYTLQTLNT